MKKITLLLTLFTLSIVNAQITFGWDSNNAIDHGNYVTETIDEVTVTFTGDAMGDDNTTQIVNFADIMGTSGNVVGESYYDSTSVTFEFSEAVNVVSILAISGTTQDIDFTFTPNGGNNNPVVASLVDGAANVDLNWTDVTSFAVSSSGSSYVFDNLIVSRNLSVNNSILEEIKIVPNPVQDFIDLSTVKQLKTLKLYNSLGQLIIETKQEKIDFSNLSRGMYFLQINTEYGTTTKKVIKG